ncbi:MAG: DinB family protein [Acidobacteriota bacterium]|nr:DinB family protein [Acidobacteriota bacterium]
MADTGKSLGRQLRRELIALLDGGQAHATFDEAVKDFPVKLRGTVPEGLPYSGWQIVEHLRIAQRDILDFSNNSEGNYKSLKWPDDYWPKAAAPPSEKAWDDSLKQIRADRKVFDKLLQDADDAELVKSFEWGDGQTVLREALLIADHNAYHTGELVVVRRLLGAWKK